MEINTSEARLRTNPASQQFVQMVRDNEDDLNLRDAQLYFNFPLYKEEENVVAANLIIVSPRHGVVVIEATDAARASAENDVRQVNESLDQVYGQIHARLTKNRALRLNKRDLLFPLEPLIFAPNLEKDIDSAELDAAVIRNRTQLKEFLSRIEIAALDPAVSREIVSVVEGAKGLIVPRPRETKQLKETSRASIVNRLEAEIASFDQEQKHGYLSVISGAQRIRGLAGSGKTVVLAMKAALTHLQYPDATIVYTFYTRSLYQHVRRLITRFYRQFDDKDPDWSQIRVMHAWGGKSKPGVYYEACRMSGVPPLTYSQVQDTASPFDTACQDLESYGKIPQAFDYVFVDEGQDFPASFLRICLKLAKQQKLVYAYDELQNIFQAEIPSVESVFGQGFRLEEDVVLKKCYRNPREVLVCAHAIGFGIYGDKIVQMLENEGHWKDVGYDIAEGTLRPGETVRILRPEENSPSSISQTQSMDQIISAHRMSSATDEVRFVAKSVLNDIKTEGLKAEDIVVLCADDRYARSYFGSLVSLLASEGISSNNLSGDSMSGDVFTRDNAVTLTSVHRAKGNEGYSVYVMGVDALFRRPTVRTRNLAFTAMTRAKAWLTVTGVGEAAATFIQELDAAKAKFPYLEFEYPGPEDLRVMKRDLEESAGQRLQDALEDVIDELDEEEIRAAIDRISEKRKKSFKK
ncbi:hypothetical protein Rumeso_03143 [Rubellimicrobium mesophilum DSM 19309]|uniref:DNA 3'-5' helicase II n=1 Tax=Rubellimicrobium mesophilum DSM 19309 TaxID=442562 RepID=A0A017HM97_9RHOB|nr:ATP-binding domain-containing protein [Rubellimicrobium mesophilum]EYD75293.1 hypothetical protein Rumeso_03143 [Rubellimicrobium mesophilum DSM 19309]